MPYDLFWYGCPSLYFSYEDAYRDKIREKDALNWQLGMYIQQAIGSCLAKECKYPQKPLFAAAPEQRPVDKNKEMMEKFEIMMQAVNQKFK